MLALEPRSHGSFQRPNLKIDVAKRGTDMAEDGTDMAQSGTYMAQVGTDVAEDGTILHRQRE